MRRKWANKTDHEENADSRKNDCGRREYLKLNVWALINNEDSSVAHQASALAKRGRESAEDIHGWIEPLSELIVATPGLIQFVGFPFKYGEDSSGRIAAFYLSSERVGKNIFAGLLLILF